MSLVTICEMNACRAHMLELKCRDIACAGMRQVDDEYKLKQNVRIAMLYLEDDDAVNAEAFIKKAATLIANCKARSLLNPAPYSAPMKQPCQHVLCTADEQGSCLPDSVECSPVHKEL